MKSLRLITDDHVTAHFGLAGDETIAWRVGSGQSEPMLRLYTYRPCALVGRFQNIATEIHLDFCQEQGIPVNRRPTGGGAIIMGEGQLGLALTVPGSSDDSYHRAREVMGELSQGLVLGLNSLGIQARLRGKNDIEVNGRKIAGLGIYRASTGGLLFHASLLVDLDIPLMLRMLNTPFEKITDKEIESFAARITTVRRESDRPISLDEARQKVAEGYAQALNVSLVPSAFTPEELQAIAVLEREKYCTPEWIYQTTDTPDSSGVGRVKTPAGLLDVRATLAGRAIKAIYIRGDFFAEDSAISNLEASLRWHSADPEAVAATVQKVYPLYQSQLNNIPLDDLLQAIQTALWHAVTGESHA